MPARDFRATRPAILSSSLDPVLVIFLPLYQSSAKSFSCNHYNEHSEEQYVPLLVHLDHLDLLQLLAHVTNHSSRSLVEVGGGCSTARGTAKGLAESTDTATLTQVNTAGDCSCESECVGMTSFILLFSFPPPNT